jgi:ABC-type nitrate/sulfonate/bicarbonate transport system substrate-binding protein
MAKSFPAFFIAVLLSLIPLAPSAHGQPIALGYSGSGISSDLRRVIEKQRLWEKHGLNVRSVYFLSGGVLTRAMAAGDITLSDSDIPAMLGLGVSGLLDVKVIAVTINRLEHYLVVRKPIMKPEELREKRVAVSGIGSASDITTRMVLRFWKLNPEKDLTILSAGNTPSRIAALTVGHVDAGLVSPDHLDKVLATGCCRVLADLSELPMDYARFGIVVPTSLLKTKRETARNVLKAYVEGIYVFKRRPDLVMEIFKEEGIKDPQVAKAIYGRLSASLRENPFPEVKGVQAALESLPNPKARGVKAEDIMDTSLLDELKSSGFIDRLYGR